MGVKLGRSLRGTNIGWAYLWTACWVGYLGLRAAKYQWSGRRLNDLYSSPNIIWVIKSLRMRWAGHVGRMGRGEVHVGFWWENLRESERLEYPGIDGSMILKWVFQMWDGALTGLIWLRTGTGGRLLWTFGFHKMGWISWLAKKPVSFLRTLLRVVS